jgi:hypothetical protein
MNSVVNPYGVTVKNPVEVTYLVMDLYSLLPGFATIGLLALASSMEESFFKAGLLGPYELP